MHWALSYTAHTARFPATICPASIFKIRGKPTQSKYLNLSEAECMHVQTHTNTHFSHLHFFHLFLSLSLSLNWFCFSHFNVYYSCRFSSKKTQQQTSFRCLSLHDKHLCSSPDTSSTMDCVISRVWRAESGIRHYKGTDRSSAPHRWYLPVHPPRRLLSLSLSFSFTCLRKGREGVDKRFWLKSLIRLWWAHRIKATDLFCDKHLWEENL